MFNVVFLATHCEHMGDKACRWPISITRRESELDTIVGEHGVDLVRDNGDQGFQKSCSRSAVGLLDFPTLAHLFADGGYGGDKLEIALLNMDGASIEIVRRSAEAKGFVVIARRWVVERIPDLVEDRLFAWLGRCRRLAKDWETTISSADAWPLIAAIRRQARYVARTQKKTGE